MKKFIIVLAFLFLAAAAHADVYVQGYTRSNGTYVQPHYRSSPNSTTSDNWSTKGNVNPYTGQYGTKSPSYGSSPAWSPKSSGLGMTNSPFGGKSDLLGW